MGNRSNRTSDKLWVGVENGIATSGDSWSTSYKIKQTLSEDLAINPQALKTHIHRKSYHGAQVKKVCLACRKPWVRCAAMKINKELHVVANSSFIYNCQTLKAKAVQGVSEKKKKKDDGASGQWHARQH